MGQIYLLGFEPKLEIGCTNGVLSITSDKRQTIKTNNPQKYIRQILEQYKAQGLTISSFYRRLGGLFCI